MGRNLTIFGNGSQSRSFCYVDDLVEGIYRVLLSTQILNTPINLGNPHEMSMLEVAKLVLILTSSKSVIEFLPLPADDPQQRCPDISKAKKALEWTPKIEIAEGLTKTIEYFRATL
jgi:UDP-glucuronate decarboxylase